VCSLLPTLHIDFFTPLHHAFSFLSRLSEVLLFLCLLVVLFLLMSSTSVAAGDRLLSTISSHLGISDAGREWVTAAIDPYHDTALRICGYPDTEESPSICQVVKRTYTISKPTSAGSGNWDAHISSFPWLKAMDVTNFTQTNNLLNPVSTGNGLNAGSGLGGLMVDTVPNTTPPTPTFQMVAAGSGTPSWVSLDSADTQVFTVGEWRQIAHGFEVVNTTSELNVQGLVTSYAAPFPQRSSKSNSSVFATETTTPPVVAIGTVEVLNASMCPTTPAAAMLLPGSRQWKAKEGAYIVPRLNNQDLAVGLDNTGVIITSSSDPVAPLFGVGTTSTSFVVPPSLFNLIVFVNEASFMTDFNWGGAYFTGLSETSTLTVNEIRIFERFPSIQIPADSQLVVLAQPSPKYDPQAVELYSVVSAMMPTGVPQKMNGFGEWFKEAVQEARNAIAPALAAIPHPLAQFAAGALRVGGSIADSYNKPPQVVSKAIPPPGAIYTPTGDTKTTVPRSVRTSIVMPAVQPIGAVQRNARRRRKAAASPAVVLAGRRAARAA